MFVIFSGHAERVWMLLVRLSGGLIAPNDIISILLKAMQNISAAPHLSAMPVESSDASMAANAVMTNFINKIHSSGLISKFLYAVNKKWS